MTYQISAPPKLVHPVYQAELGVPPEHLPDTVRSQVEKHLDELRGDKVMIGAPQAWRLERHENLVLVQVVCSFLPARDHKIDSASLGVRFKLPGQPPEKLRIHDIYPRTVKARRSPVNRTVWVAATKMGFRLTEDRPADTAAIQIDDLQLIPEIRTGEEPSRAIWDFTSTTGNPVEGYRVEYLLLELPADAPELGISFAFKALVRPSPVKRLLTFAILEELGGSSEYSLNLLTLPVVGSKELPHIISSVPLSDVEEAVLRQAHWGFETILVEEIPGGFSGARVLLIWRVTKDGYRAARIVTKLGSAPELRQERSNYAQYVGPFLPFCVAQVDLNRYYELDDLAALNYVFVGGGALGKAMTLEKYYAAAFPNGVDQLKRTLSQLLDENLGQSWYGQTKPLACFFREEYGRHLVGHSDERGRHQVDHAQLRKDISTVFPELALDDDSGFIHLPCEPKADLRSPYPNPLLVYPDVLGTVLVGRQSHVHGDLHLRNVLVDESGKGWLIDFAKVAERHNLCDFIRLETRVRTWELPPEYTTEKLSDYLAFEEALSNATLGLDATPPDDPRLKFAYEVILHIRQIAQKYMGPDPDFRNEYLPALFLYCLAVTKYCQNNEGESSARLAFATTCVLARYFCEERDRQTVEQIVAALDEKQLSQDEATEIADELRKWTRDVQRSRPSLSQKTLGELNLLAQHTSGVYQYLELALPIIPGILNYKIELGSQHLTDLSAIWERIRARFSKDPET